MKRWQLFILLTTLLILVNIATWAVITLNQSSGVYPVNADSIGIPIIGTTFISMLTLPLITTICFMPLSKFLKRLCTHGKAWGIAAAIILLLLYVGVGLFAISGIVSWIIPDHYLIAASYLLFLTVLAASFIRDVKLVFSNGSINSDWLTVR